MAFKRVKYKEDNLNLKQLRELVEGFNENVETGNRVKLENGVWYYKGYNMAIVCDRYNRKIN